MFGIILGTVCLVLLVSTIRRERYYRRHGYPQRPHGYYGCHHGCGGYGHYPPRPEETPPAPPAVEGKPAEGATP